MDINILNSQEPENLNKLQKYFYEHSLMFLRNLDEGYFDLSESFYRINKIEDKLELELRLVSKNKSEINITIYINSEQLIVFVNGWSGNILYKDIPIIEFYDDLEKFLVFALSDCCKIVTYKSNNKPYKWVLYAFEENTWRAYSSTRLLIYNFFGKRTKEEKQSKLFKGVTYPKDFFRKYL